MGFGIDPLRVSLAKIVEINIFSNPGSRIPALEIAPSLNKTKGNLGERGGERIVMRRQITARRRRRYTVTYLMEGERDRGLEGLVKF